MNAINQKRSTHIINAKNVIKKGYRQPIILCKNCGEKKEHQAHGICRNCYIKKYYKENPDRYKEHQVKKLHNIEFGLWKEITALCTICGFDKVIDLHHIDGTHANNSRENLIGLCPNHHRMIHNSQYSKEIKEKLR